ncbi:MAG: hypothetical protein VKP57_09525 [Candidatus Sericytochromatia bacterium]|nr:hypothetical protein [Candidatus Sericytochromatia bacterium]
MIKGVKGNNRQAAPQQGKPANKAGRGADKPAHATAKAGPGPDKAGGAGKAVRPPDTSAKPGKADKGRQGGDSPRVMVQVPPPAARGKAEPPVPRAVEANPEYQAAMATLQDNGILTKKLRKQLNRLLSAAEPAGAAAPPSAFAAGGAAPAAPKAPDKAGQLLLNLVKHLAHPESIIQGEGTWSCTVASLQATVAQMAPGRYARMVVDLATTGQTKVPGNARIDADHRGLRNEADGRDPIEDLFQESMLSAAQRWEGKDKPALGLAADGDYGGGAYGRGAYGSGRRYGNGTYRAGRRYGSDDDSAAGRGLTARGYTRLVSEVFGKAHDVLRATPEQPLERAETMHLTQAALKRGPVPAGVSFPSEDGKTTLHHAIRIVGVEDATGRSTLRPDKKIDGQKPGKPAVVIVADPQTGEKRSVPIDRFMKDLDFLTLPEEILHPPMSEGMEAFAAAYMRSLGS